MNFLEDYHEILEILPKELQRHMTNLLELNSLCLKNDQSVDNLITTMDQKGLQLSLEERRAIGDNLEKSLKEAIHLSKGKVFLANQAYDTVDKYIRRLDNDINRFQVALARHQSEKFEPSEERDLKFRTGDLDLSSSGLFSNGAGGNVRRNRKRSTAGTVLTTSQMPSTEETTDDMFDEFPIDPNEPTYCLCHQVSFGEMIACDNDDCDIKWFHWDCIGMETLPKGKWFCPNCTTAKRQQKKK